MKGGFYFAHAGDLFNLLERKPDIRGTHFPKYDSIYKRLSERTEKQEMV